MAPYVFVTSIGASLPRARLLVEALASRDLQVVADQGAGGVADYELEFAAACIVMAWGHPRDKMYMNVVSSVRFQMPVFFVKIEDGAAIPGELDSASVIDLTDWTGGEHPDLTRLAEMLQRASNYHFSKLYRPRLDPGTVDRAEFAVDRVSATVVDVQHIDDLLDNDSIQAQEINATLRELGGTYSVVKSAVRKFFAAGLGPDGMDGEAFAFLERGTLAEEIHNGRAHCKRIGARYYREGGIRQALAARNAGLLSAADELFEELTNSDHDFLDMLDALGYALTGESRAILVLLLAGQEKDARQRIVDARDLILPLEDKLDAALAAFKVVEMKLGYAEDRVIRQEAQVTIMNVSIGGGNVGCNIVVAELIKESSISLGTPAISGELRQYLTELHKAVAELSTRLPDDEALLAARDLKDLTDEIASGKPREALWKRATNGLLDTAKQVAAVGLPVIDLVNKIIPLLSGHGGG